MLCSIKKVKTLELAVAMTWKYKEIADKLSEKSAIIDANMKSYRFAENMSLIKDIIF
jgi:hypothetical protein